MPPKRFKLSLNINQLPLSHSHQRSFLNTLGKMDESHLDEDAISVQAPEKCKTTYSRDHPTKNPKPPKRTKAEIQQAAKEKKEAKQAKKAAAVAEKKKKHLEAEE